MCRKSSLTSSPGGRIGKHCCWCGSLFPCIYRPFALARKTGVFAHGQVQLLVQQAVLSGVLRTRAAWMGSSSTGTVCASTLLVLLHVLWNASVLSRAWLFPAFPGWFSCRRFLCSIALSDMFLLNPFGNSTGYFLAVNVRTLSRVFFPPGLGLIAFGNLRVSPLYFYCASSDWNSV